LAPGTDATLLPASSAQPAGRLLVADNAVINLTLDVETIAALIVAGCVAHTPTFPQWFGGLPWLSSYEWS